MKRLLGLASFCFGVTIACAGFAQTPTQGYWSGKRVTLLIGSSPIGGIGYDTYGRVMAKYIGKYLPGRPLVVPENKPGAGGLTLANHIYHSAAKDGSEIGLLLRGNAMDPLLNPDAAKGLDGTRFNWLGSMNNEVAGFFITEKARVRNLEEVM